MKLKTKKAEANSVWAVYDCKKNEIVWPMYWDYKEAKAEVSRLCKESGSIYDYATGPVWVQ